VCQVGSSRNKITKEIVMMKKAMGRGRGKGKKPPKR
jgi:hypothetical protein